MSNGGPRWGGFQYTEEGLLTAADVDPNQEPKVFDNPCDAADFISERIARDERFAPTPATRAEIYRIYRDCPSATIPAVPAPHRAEDASSTAPDVAPVADEPTAEQLGAPSPKPTYEVVSDPPAPYESSGRSLAEDYRRPLNPMPDHDVVAHLAEQGVSIEQMDEALGKVIRNEPPEAAPHPDFSENRRESLDATADPVLVFSGQFQLDITDVEIASRGFALSFRRLYRSGTTAFGPLGYNWDHNYNVYLRPLDDGAIAVWTGALSEHVYVPGPQGFVPPFSVFRRLEFEAADAAHPDRWVLAEREGRELIFSMPAGWPDPNRVPLVQIRDRFGNAHDLAYNAEGRLQQVADHATRFLRFEYGDCGLLERMHDHTGRVWRYEHDPEIEHLLAVTLPATPDYPQGITARYEYDRFRAHPAMIHNLTRVMDGNGAIVVENFYGDEPMSDDFNRVVVQEFGGFRTEFTATRLQYVPTGPDAINVPALRVEVIDPGYYYVYTFNNRGDLLDKRFRLVVDGSWRLVVSAFSYDEQGNLSERYDADGRGVVFEYDTLNADPRARGNLLRVVERASPLAPAPSQEVFRATYEPRYWQMKTHRDALGALTEFIYDYEVGPPLSGRGALVELRHPVITLPDGSSRVGVELFVYSPAGQLSEHRENGVVHQFEYESTGGVAGYLRRRTSTKLGVLVEERFEHDAVGNLTARIDGTGNRQEYEVNALGLVTTKRLADGSTWRFQYDVANHLAAVNEPRGDYDDPVLAGRDIRHEFRYDVLGRLMTEIKGVNTAAPRTSQWQRTAEGDVVELRDALGRLARTQIDERGLPLREEMLAADGSSLLVRRFRYNKVGQLERIQVDGGPAVALTYDGFGRPLRIEGPDGTQLHYVRDARGLATTIELTGRLGGSGTMSGLLARRRFELDERGQVRRAFDVLFTNPLGPFTDATTVFWRDDAGQAERVETPAGLVIDRLFGPYGRLIEQRDSLGHVLRTTFDTAGRDIELAVTTPSASGPVVTSFFKTYDTVGRVAGERDALGNTTGYAYDARGALRRLTNPLGAVLTVAGNAFGELVSHTLGEVSIRWERDAAGRPIAFTDPTGSTTRFTFDELDRLREVERPDSMRQRYRYEASGALASFEDFDGTRLEYVNDSNSLPRLIHAVPGLGVAPTPDTELAYDGLRRVVRAAYGETAHERTYDSFSRLLSETDAETVAFSYDAAGRTRRITYPDGRQDRNEHDELGRLRRCVHELGGALPLAAHGLGVGSTLAEFEWRDAERLASIRAVGLETEFDYDPTARLTGIHHRLGAATVQREAHVRDGLGLLRGERQAAPAESAREFVHDGLTRLSVARAGLPAATFPWSTSGLNQAQLDALATAATGAAASGRSEFAYTAGDAPQSRVERDGGGAILSAREFASNALHQVTLADGVPLVYDAAGNVRSYGARTFRFDGFRRLVEVADGGITVAQLRYDGFGRVHERTFNGATQRLTWSGDELLQVSAAGGPMAQFTPSPVLDRPVLAHNAAASHALAHDGLGSLVAACTLGGAVAERYRYDVFGSPEILAPDGTTVRPVSGIGLDPHFHGRPYLAASRLYDFRNRAYDPQIFLFLQPDPFPLSGSWNPYSFVHYNPLDYLDPFGEFWNIVAAAIGAVMGGVGAWLSGGDWKDVLVGMGAGAVGGALTACGMPVLGGALGGGIMGAWSGGRVGYQRGGTEGAIIGVVGGGILGAGLGAVSGGIASFVGGAVSTRVYGTVFNRALAAGLSGQTTANAARYSSMVAGGYVGGASAGVFGNVSSTVALDVATGQPVTTDQLAQAFVHGIAIDGPLNVVGAAGDRFVFVGRFRGNLGNVLGAEGEALVGRSIGHEPTNGRQRITINGRQRRPDFDTNDTFADFDAGVEVKNKQRLSSSDLRQISDFAQHALNNGADLLLFHRPGMDLTPVAGIGNLRPVPIPQQPLVVAMPVPFPQRRQRGEK